jgi:hypothetical protein
VPIKAVVGFSSIISEEVRFCVAKGKILTVVVWNRLEGARFEAAVQRPVRQRGSVFYPIIDAVEPF